ncbi:hypothetical protein D1631_05610 [Chryseobacterium nematophagum]|uniref:Peptidase A2 domain-containing protein n=1 Tax=Chryseobacterium nematophagum TaxID=2305228 RepID=A0A3M7TEP1_9FLAO|nr:retropepsin-like aspartic protease [Chryseobacterium nematophagum]RNA61446.1 hypothetical protein D1631_05610 [Chryseobacterium nematophagum]
MIRKYLFTVVFTLLFPLLVGAKMESDFKRSLDCIFKALKTKNYDEEMKSLFTLDAKIGYFPKGQNDFILPQLLQILPVPTTYSFKEIESRGNSTVVDVCYIVSDKSNFLIQFLFTEENKIIHLSFDNFTNKTLKRQLKKIKILPSPFKSNFSLENKIICVKAFLNWKEELFILDNGYSDFILNSNKKNIQKSGISEDVIKGIGGKAQQMEMAWIDMFNWGGRIWKNDTKVKTAHIPQLKGKGNEIAGIIGYEVLKDKLLTLDYSNQLLEIGFYKDLNHEISEYGKLLMKLPFKIKNNLPVFYVEVNGVTYTMGLDTGATINLMKNKYLSAVENLLYDSEATSITGFNGNIKVTKYKIKETKIGGISYNNMAFSFDDHLLDKYHVDGILGYEFLKKYITVIDFKSNEIRVYAEIKQRM